MLNPARAGFLNLWSKVVCDLQAGDHIQLAEAGKDNAPATKDNVPATTDGLPATGDGANSNPDRIPSTSYGSNATESNTRWDAKKRAVKVNCRHNMPPVPRVPISPPPHCPTQSALCLPRNGRSGSRF